MSANSLVWNTLQVSRLLTIFCGFQARYPQANLCRINNLSASVKKNNEGYPERAAAGWDELPARQPSL